MAGHGEHHFSRWFLFSSAYDSWHGLRGWFDDEGDGASPPAAADAEESPPAPSAGARRATRRS